MAPLNPSIPTQGVSSTNDPNYLSYSRPISEYQGDTSYAALFKGVGDVASAAIKGADFLVKDKIDTEVTDTIYREREAYTAALESGREAVTGRPLGILNTTDADLKVPSGVSVAIGQAGSLQSALDSGKISQTYYHGRLTALAKAMRNEYPGYRDYIDRKIASITGSDPANAYISNLISDINSVSTKKDKTLEDARGILKAQAADGNVASAQAYNALDSGQLSPDAAMIFAAKQTEWKADIDRRELLRKDTTGSRESLLKDTTDTLNLKLAQESASRFSAIQLSAGLNTPQQISQVIQDAQTGKSVITDDQARALGNSIEAQKNAYIQWAQKEGNKPGPDGRTYRQIIGPENFNKLVEANAANFTNVSDAIFKKDYGAAFDNANMVNARIESYKNGILSSPDTAPIALSLAGLKSFGGDEAVRATSQWFITSGQGQKWSEYLRGQAYTTFSQPDLRKSGNYVSLREHIVDAKNKNISDGKYYDTILKIPERLTDPKTTDFEKINIAKAAFGEKNSGFLSEFPVDSIDSVSGKQVKGRYSAYARMTSEGITSEIKRLSKQDPSLWTDYVNWTANEFRNDLFGQEIRTLSTFQKDPNVKVSYNSDTQQFRLDYGRGISNLSKPEDPFERAAQRTPLPTARYKEADAAINRLNFGLSGMARVAKDNGSDPNTFLLNILIDAGYDPTKGGGLRNLPDALAQEVANTLAKKGK